MYSFLLEEGEAILKKGMATLQCDGMFLPGQQMYINTLSGALYLTTERIVFIGYLRSATTRHMEEFPLVHIEEIRPEKSLLIFPNAIRIRTIRNQEYLLVVQGRNDWLNQIQKQMGQV